MTRPGSSSTAPSPAAPLGRLEALTWQLPMRLPSGTRPRILLGAVLLAALMWDFVAPTTGLVRGLLVILALLVVLTLLLTFRPTLLHEFLFGVEPAVNLAIFRIVLFAVLIGSSAVAEALVYSHFSQALVRPPDGLEALSGFVTQPGLVSLAAALFLFFGALSVLGVLTRASAGLTFLLGLYVLGVPQFFGKVNHYHHLLWFAGLLAVSRCGDALSVDALVRAIRRGARGQTAPPEPAHKYALPLRVTWLLIGFTYFFPGLWKFVNVGVTWAWSDNLKYIMYHKWVEQAPWEPLFRVDSYPWLYRTSGLFTLVFEIFFIVLVLSPVLRPVLAASGVAFHNATAAFLNIRFSSLQAMYVSLLNWDGIFRRLGSWVLPEPLVFVYDSRARWHGRIVAVARALDLLGRVRYVDAGRGATRQPHGAAAQPWRVATPASACEGAPALRALARRLPLVWPALPLLYLPVVTRAVEGAARSPQRALPASVAPAGRAGVVPVVVAGLVLLAVNGFAGAARHGNAWPFAMYPTFAYERTEAVATTLSVELHRTDGGSTTLGLGDLHAVMHPARLGVLLLHLAEEPDSAQQHAKAAALVDAMQQRGIPVDGVANVTVHRDTLVTLPEERRRNPIEREPLLTMPLDLAGERRPARP